MHAEPKATEVNLVDVTDALLVGSSAVVCHWFAAVDAGVSPSLAPAINLTAFTSALEAALTGLAGLSCKITSVGAPASNDTDPASINWYTAGSSQLGIALSTTLAEALVNARCGGS